MMRILLTLLGIVAIVIYSVLGAMLMNDWAVVAASGVPLDTTIADMDSADQPYSADSRHGLRCAGHTARTCMGRDDDIAPNRTAELGNRVAVGRNPYPGRAGILLHFVRQHELSRRYLCRLELRGSMRAGGTPVHGQRDRVPCRRSNFGDGGDQGSGSEEVVARPMAE